MLHVSFCKMAQALFTFPEALLGTYYTPFFTAVVLVAAFSAWTIPSASLSSLAWAHTTVAALHILRVFSYLEVSPNVTNQSISDERAC